MCPTPTDRFAGVTPMPIDRGGVDNKRRQKDLRARVPGYLLLGCNRRVAVIKSQQYDCLNKSCIMTISVDMPMWMGDVSQSNIPRQRAERRKICFKGKRVTVMEMQTMMK